MPAPDAIPNLVNSFARPPWPASQTESTIRGRTAAASLPLGFRYAKLTAYAAAFGVPATSRYPRGQTSHPITAAHRAFSRMLYTPCFGRLSILERHDAMLRSPKQSPKTQTCSNSGQSEKQLAACGFRFPRLFPAGLEHGKNEQRDNAGQRSAAMRYTRSIARFAVFFALGICMMLGYFRFPHRGFLRLAATAAHSGHIKTRPRSVRARQSLLPILLRRLPRLLGFPC